ncbi:MAG: isoamylase early set domain-containing protein [Planctomycetes bacterium]|nr:isoamylase early set domain-containing protein [Planctomycetota bacterium]
MVTKSIPNVRGDKTASTQVTFSCDLKPEAREVYLAGSFNKWNPRSDRMVRKNGSFQKVISLPAGEYRYKFVIDGNWLTDPKAALQVSNAIGGTNSVIKVGK